MMMDTPADMFGTAAVTAAEPPLPPSQRDLLHRYAVWIAAFIVVAGTLLLYVRILSFSFVNYDDGTNIFHNPYVDPPSLHGLAYLWTHGYYELYMPVTYTVWALLARLAPLSTGHQIYVPGAGYADIDPVAFHGLSLAIHTIDAVLVFTLLRRLLGKPWPAAAGALFFAVHPMQVESVAWVTGMNNLTSSIFGLLALLHYVIYAQKGEKEGWRFALATIFYLLALLSKPTAVALPLIAAVLEWGLIRRPIAWWIKPLGLWAALALALVIITRFTSADTGHKIVLALWVRPFIAGDALAVYLGKVLLPLKTSIISGRTMYLVQQSWWGYVTWLFPAALAFVLWRSGERARSLQTGVALFVAALLPMLGFVPYYIMEKTTVSDRYLYLALIGPALMLAWFAGWSRVPVTVRSVTVVLLLAALCLKTSLQLPYWHDTYTLSVAQLAVNPGDAQAQTNYAITLAEQGQIDQALPHFREAAHLAPDEPTYQYHYGATLADQGKLAEAVAPLQAAVRLSPDLTVAQARLGGTLIKLGRDAEAVTPLQAALAAAPADSANRYILSIALGNLHRYPEAEAEMQQVVAHTPTIQGAAYTLGLLQERQGKRTEAAKSYRLALSIKPDDTAAAAALARIVPVTPSSPQHQP